jgi:hypothetical protein
VSAQSEEALRPTNVRIKHRVVIMDVMDEDFIFSLFRNVPVVFH